MQKSSKSEVYVAYFTSLMGVLVIIGRGCGVGVGVVVGVGLKLKSLIRKVICDHICDIKRVLSYFLRSGRKVKSLIMIVKSDDIFVKKIVWCSFGWWVF